MLPYQNLCNGHHSPISQKAPYNKANGFSDQHPKCNCVHIDTKKSKGNCQWVSDHWRPAKKSNQATPTTNFRLVRFDFFFCQFGIFFNNIPSSKPTKIIATHPSNPTPQRSNNNTRCEIVIGQDKQA